MESNVTASYTMKRQEGDPARLLCGSDLHGSCEVFLFVLFPVLIYSKTEKGKEKKRNALTSTVRPGKSEPAPKAWGSSNSRLAEMKGEKEGRM